MLNKEKNLNFKADSGYVIVMLPFILMVMLAALGLVVDASNIYAARVKAGAAVEQGILSAIGARIIERSPTERQSLVSSSYEENYLRTRFDNAVRNNLGNNGITSDPYGPINPFSISTTLVNNPGADVTFINDTTTATLKMRGNVVLRVPVFFGGVYGFYGHSRSSGNGNNPDQEYDNSLTTTSVDSAAIGELRGSAFVFLVDMSSSQSCPSVGNCLCNTTRRNDPAVGGSCRQEAINLQNSGSLPPDQRGTGNIRIEDIRSAVNMIVSGNVNGAGNLSVPVGLDPARDRVSIVIYNNSAQVLVPFDLGKPVNGGIVTPGYRLNDMAPLISRINASDRTTGVPNAIVPGGNTNISDALITAKDEITRVGLLNPAAKMKGRINVILMSEGAATAMRVQPDNAALASNAPAAVVDQLPIPVGDYINVELSMQTGPNTFTQIPSPMMKTVDYKRLVSINSTDPNKPTKAPMLPKSQDSSGGYPDTVLPACHLDAAEKAKVDLFSNELPKRQASLEECLGATWKTKPAKARPGTSDTNRGFNSGIFNVSNSLVNNSNLDFRNMYYLATVRATELLSDDSIRLSTISWGPLAAENQNTLFELQSVSNVKKEVLQNLSNDRDNIIGKEETNPDLKKAKDKWGKDQFKDFFGSNLGVEAKKFRGTATGSHVNAPSATEFEKLLNNLVIQAKLAVVGIDKELQ